MEPEEWAGQFHQSSLSEHITMNTFHAGSPPELFPPPSFGVVFSPGAASYLLISSLDLL